MFTEKRAVFFHCVSPVHMGSGTALGVIDNPIQRERQNGFPVLAGSGVKGALRHHRGPGAETDAIFGPEDASHAGALSFTDAQLVLLPVRSARQGFAYVTCPAALAVARRLLLLAGLAVAWEVPEVKDEVALVAGPSLLKDGKLALELFEFAATESMVVKQLAGQLAGYLPAGEAWAYFRKKLAADVAVLSDTDFTFFSQNAMTVEPHVGIDDTTGAADGGKLFYTENLPAESLLVALMLTSATRVKPMEGGAAGLAAGVVADRVAAGLGEQQLLQIGGDATTGRGQVVLTFAEKGVA